MTWPAELKEDAGAAVGDKLIAEFDPLAAADLEIVDFNEATGELQPFEVKRIEIKGKTQWVIPSHDNYPADAKDQVALAATSLLGLQILGEKGNRQEDYETYGVIDSKDMKDNSRGVGMKVTLRDKQGKDLVSLVIGKEVPDHKGQRYVRVAGQKPVYIVEMKTDNLSTRFDRWIEKSLLKINPWDISRLWIRDHIVDAEMVLREREEMVIEYNDKSEPHWKLLEDRRKDDATKQWAPFQMAEDETLNAPKLDELKTALGELQIVDVERKPEGLSADLKASENFMKSRQAIEALGERGFFVGKIGNNYELYSNNGEFRCMMNDGVEYILRFGDVALQSTLEEKNKDSKDAQNGKPAEKKGPGVNRYLFVMAQFNPAGIPEPKLAPLPGDAPADENKPVPSEENKPVEAKPASYLQDKPTEEQPVDEKKTPAADEQAKEKPANAETVPPTGPAEENPVALPTDPKILEASREEVEKENQRKRDEYQRKIEAGKKRVEELNARFADWFYVISDDTYQKIHLTHENLFIKKSELKEKNPGGPNDMPPGMMDLPPGLQMPGGR
jgi:hypothetical protein